MANRSMRDERDRGAGAGRMQRAQGGMPGGIASARPQAPPGRPQPQLPPPSGMQGFGPAMVAQPQAGAQDPRMIAAMGPLGGMGAGFAPAAPQMPRPAPQLGATPPLVGGRPGELPNPPTRVNPPLPAAPIPGATGPGTASPAMVPLPAMAERVGQTPTAAPGPLTSGRPMIADPGIAAGPLLGSPQSAYKGPMGPGQMG